MGDWEMKSVYIIPKRENIEESLRLSKEYNAYFEYNDFFIPAVLDDEEKKKELIQFYKIHIKRASNSEYEKFFIDKYLEFVLNHNNPNKLPILIPELRFWGEKKEHKYRLDFTILNIYTQRFVGFEISPSSSHMHVQKTKNKSQAEINSEISTQWQKEMTKRNDYFSKFNITLITFTDNDLNDLDKCFDTIKNELKINLDTKTDNDYINLIKQI